MTLNVFVCRDVLFLHTFLFCVFNLERNRVSYLWSMYTMQTNIFEYNESI